MRRVGLTPKQRLQAGNPKFHAGKNPVELETDIDIIEPTDAAQQQQLSAMVDKMYEQSSSDPAIRNGLALWKTQMATGAMSDQVKLQFLRRFYFWLLGRGTEDDTKKTMWGRGNAAVHNKEVAAYIEQFARKRTEYALLLSLMANRVPETLNGYYLYYKYIVNGKLQRSVDQHGKEWWDLSKDDFLEDFDLFQKEFDHKHKEARYSEIIAPAANRSASQAPFQASEPYPATAEQRAQYALDDEKAQDDIAYDQVNQRFKVTPQSRKAGPYQRQPEEPSTNAAPDGAATPEPEVGPAHADPMEMGTGDTGYPIEEMERLTVVQMEHQQEMHEAQMAEMRAMREQLTAAMKAREFDEEALKRHNEHLGERLAGHLGAAMKEAIATQNHGAFEATRAATEKQTELLKNIRDAIGDLNSDRDSAELRRDLESARDDIKQHEKLHKDHVAEKDGLYKDLDEIKGMLTAKHVEMDRRLQQAQAAFDERTANHLAQHEAALAQLRGRVAAMTKDAEQSAVVRGALQQEITALMQQIQDLTAGPMEQGAEAVPALPAIEEAPAVPPKDKEEAHEVQIEEVEEEEKEKPKREREEEAEEVLLIEGPAPIEGEDRPVKSQAVEPPFDPKLPKEFDDLHALWQRIPQATGADEQERNVADYDRLIRDVAKMHGFDQSPPPRKINGVEVSHKNQLKALRRFRIALEEHVSLKKQGPRAAASKRRERAAATVKEKREERKAKARL